MIVHLNFIIEMHNHFKLVILNYQRRLGKRYFTFHTQYVTKKLGHYEELWMSSFVVVFLLFFSFYKINAGRTINNNTMYIVHAYVHFLQRLKTLELWVGNSRDTNHDCCSLFCNFNFKSLSLYFIIWIQEPDSLYSLYGIIVFSCWTFSFHL